MPQTRRRRLRCSCSRCDTAAYASSERRDIGERNLVRVDDRSSRKRASASKMHAHAAVVEPQPHHLLLVKGLNAHNPVLCSGSGHSEQVRQQHIWSPRV
eukprot:scaffold853_cov386-Prasinococcus_capsulatus_cf.AAC.6